MFDPFLRIGSRGSHLALWQAEHIASRLAAIGVRTEIQVIKTTGDHLQTASLVQAGGKGLFTREIETALLDGSVDLAVHSLKDLPTEDTPGLAISAVPEREDARDALLGSTLGNLPPGARVGTSSGRRAAQLLAIRSDLSIEPVRGNVDTRIRKLKEGQYDAIVLACAGLRRLGLAGEIAELFSADQLCPAAGQGALAIQTRAGDPAAQICRRLNHLATERAVHCERHALSRLGGGCQLPVGVFAEVSGDTIVARAAVVSPDGSEVLRAFGEGPSNNPENLGEQLAAELLARGAGSILAVAR